MNEAQQIAHEPDRGPVATKEEQNFALLRLGVLGVAIIAATDIMLNGANFIYTCANEQILFGALGYDTRSIIGCVQDIPLWLQWAAHHVK